MNGREKRQQQLALYERLDSFNQHTTSYLSRSKDVHEKVDRLLIDKLIESKANVTWKPRKHRSFKPRRPVPVKKILLPLISLALIFVVITSMLPVFYGGGDFDINIFIEPTDPVEGDLIFINATIPTQYNITQVWANISGINMVNLTLMDNSTTDHFWQGTWILHNLSAGDHLINISALDYNQTLYYTLYQWSITSNISDNESLVDNTTTPSDQNDTNITANESMINETTDILDNDTFTPENETVPPTNITDQNITVNTTIPVNESISIVDPQEEHLDVVPGTSFYVERTVDGPHGTEVIFVPLFSDALTLDYIEILEDNKTTEQQKKIDSTATHLYTAGKATSSTEQKIETIRQTLQLHTRELDQVAYSTSFELHSPRTVRIWFTAPSFEDMQSGNKPSSGHISYLVLTNDDNMSNTSYDYEGSTWWNANWGYRKLITVNHSQVDADLTNFPILVYESSDSDLASKAQDDGDDIAFVLWSDNSTQLNHEIELFNGTSGKLAAWVNITSLSSSVDTKIWMYYNNSGCSSQENIDDTWNADYVGVWHLNHTSGNATDSTANNNDGNEYISPDTNMDTTGKTDGADYFDGSDDYLQPPALAVRSASSSFTVTGWFKATNSSNGPLWMWGDNAAPSSSGAAETPVGWRSSSGNFSAGFYSGGHFYAEASQNYTDDVWHFAAQVGDGVTGYLYIDGQQLNSTTAGYTYASNPYLLLGVRTKDSSSDIDNIAYFNGSLDEIRVSDIARNSSWINTSYNTMNNINTFISVSSERNITDTSVDMISPYTITSSPLIINATGSSGLDNVTLWYRWSSDNFTSLGTGSDGAKTITADDTIINNYTYLTGNENSAETTITVNDASEFNAGDEILIIQMQNSSGGISGTYEFATISSKSGNDITLNSGLTNSYYSGTFDQTSSTSTQIVSVPHYTTVTVNSNANITAPAWDGYDGGIVVFRAIGGVTVNGAINVSGKGYRGGLHGTPSSCGSGEGEQGESYPGKGGCGGYVAPGGENPNGGGAGLEVTGGGGGYGTAGEDSESWNGGGADVGAGGLQHGVANLEQILLGSGGGGCYQGGSGSGDGGDGGGIIIVFANSVSVSGGIKSKGQDGLGWGQGSWLYGTGGGSGGSIYISAADLNISNNLVNATGGVGYQTTRDGGDGGTGRIRLDYGNLTGTTNPVSGYNGSAPDVDGCNWIEWNNTNNPDTNYASGGWNWTFDFPNGTGYYEFYSIGNKSGSPNETAPTGADAICYYAPPTLPIVTTNASTGVEETNATLRGYLSSDGDLTTSCGFRYGTSSGSYTENFTKGTYSSGTEFSNNNGSLTQGQIYFYQAWAKNSLGFVNGTEMTFLTKPDPPNNLIAQTNSTSVIYLTWATGIGTNNTYIERNASGQTVWTRGSGNMTYNGSGTNYEDTGLSEGITYYYQAWSYVNWTYDSTTLHQWSDNNASANNITHDIPSIELVNPSPNGTTGVVTQPICQIWANDSDSSTITVYWYENSTGPSYALRNTSSESANSIVNYTFTEFDTYNTTYWWKVSVNDSIYNTTKWYYFTTGLIDTSVDTISPYTATYSPYNITATGPSDLDNVTLWYRYSTDNSSWGGNVSWNDASNPDNASLWSWGFDFPDGIGYYEFYSLGNKSGSPNETVPSSADAICYFNASVNNPPTQSNEVPANQSTGISLTPQLNIVVDDGDLDTVNATWWSNSSGPWVQFASNLSIDTSSGAVNIIQTNSNFTRYLTTYWWSVNLSDGNGGWSNETYYFTTEPINTSVDTINPYTQTNSPLTINATGPSSLENVTLWYKYSNDNSTWWNYSWSKSKPIYLNVSSGTTPTNYQILLNITYMNDMNNNFSDLRFVNYTNTSMELDYWIENKSDGNWANVWLEINSSINTTNQSLVWMYYGNPSATSNSNGTATFEFFDDFPGASLDTNIWSATGSYSVNDGITITTGAVYTDSMVLSSPQDLTFEMKAQYTGADASYSGLEIADAQSTSGSNGGANALTYHMTDSGGQDITLWGADGTVASYNIVSGGALTPNPTLGTDYILGYSFYGSTDISYFYQNLDYSEIDRATYSGTWDYPFYLWLGYFTGSASGTTNIDDITVSWVRIRKYRSSEPTYYIGNEVNSWMQWSGTNPDDDSPWSWEFDFSDGGGYYEFYSIGKKSGSTDESPPSSADAMCHYPENTSINVTPSQWNIGTIDIGDTNETTGFYFNLTNEGNVALDITINATNATNTTTQVQWNLTATPAHDNFSLQYNKSGAGSWTNINITFDTFTSLAIGGYQTFDLKLLMATTSSTVDPMDVTVTFKSVAS